ncbi:MAG TPA: hypothetical protein VL400_17495 [Polyangiaceae bacterium]|nr:hypothetical protein [Polyangiaceae bacterium]
MTSDARALDATVDLDGVTKALDDGETLALRAAPLLDAPTEEGFGPEPKRSRVVVLERGTRAVTIDAVQKAVVAVRVSSRALAWGGWGGKAFERGAASVEIELDGGERLVVADVLGDDETSAKERAARLAEALEAALGPAGAGATEGAGSAKNQAAAASRDAAPRFVLGMEGDLLVLRDFASTGPRNGAGRYRFLAIAALGLGAVAWWQFVVALRAASALSSLLGLAAVGVVLLVAAFAMNEIARFAAKYSADNEPLAWFSDDHVVVAPWVSRKGAVDLRPEGRYGAAIKIPEINAVVLRDHEGKHAVMLETEHGPIDVLYADDLATAKTWRGAVERALVSVAAPTKRAIPLVRARASAEA